MADHRRTPAWTASARLDSACWSDDEPVCALPDWQAHGLPRFGDDRWDFRGHPHAIDKASEHGWLYDWGAVANPTYALAMREFAMGRMNRPLQLPGVARFSWPASTTIIYLRALEGFFAWVGTELAGLPLAAIGQDDLSRYAQTVLSGRGSIAQQTGRLRAVQAFFAYFTIAGTSRPAAEGLPLSFATELIPWGGKSVSALAGRNRSEANRTPRIPPAVMDPLLRQALFYVEIAAGDILGAHRELQSYPCDAACNYGTDDHSDRLEEFLENRPVPTYANGKPALARICMAARLPRRSLQTPQARRRLDTARRDHGTEIVEWLRPREDLLRSLQRFVADRRHTGRGIPVYDAPEGGKNVGDVNVALSLAMCGHHPAADALHYREAAAILEAAHAEFGGEPGGMNAPISTNPDTGRPWRPPFSPASLARETRLLQTACFIVITYLSGMRVDEVLALQPGCCRQDVSADGLVYVHRLASTLSKGQPKPAPATWVVTEHVHRAVGVLEQLPRSPARSAEGRVTVRARRRVDRLFQFGTNLGVEIGLFVARLGDLGEEGQDQLGSRGINARALRRTLAWYIAHRPFGTTALAIQYKHVHATISEGYVGVADEEFRDLLVTETVEAELEALAQRIITRRGGVAAVRAATPNRTSERIEELVRDTARFPGLVDHDGHYELRLLRDEHLSYHVAGCANCAYDPAVSLCNRGGDHPIMARCRWWECGCAEHLPEHLSALGHAIAEAEGHLRLRRLPAPQRRVLRGQLGAMQAARDAIVEVRGGP
ncbi:MAG: hypothetical protein ACYDB7_04915 [Mycobacteriales bacterium]